MKISRSTAIVLLFLFCAVAAEAYTSKAWRERIDARTATLWIDAQNMGDGIILNARGELNVTWIERKLMQYLDRDRDADDWVVDNLVYYSSNRKDTRAQVKGKDVFVLNYRAGKYWDFDPTKLVINGYAITKNDILTKEEYWDSEGNLPPGAMGTVAVAAPSLKTGASIELAYEDARATLQVPSK